VVSEGVGAGGEMIQALYAHMNNKKKKTEFVPKRMGCYKASWTSLASSLASSLPF
jgi:hypothetical protein